MKEPINNSLSKVTKRIIPCLDVKDGRTVKGVNFLELKDAGDPVELAAKYAKEGADELVFLDISATTERRKTMTQLVRETAKVLNIPFTIGGGISSIYDAAALLESGADKVSINSAAVKNPNLVEELAKEFGEQFVVIAVDTKLLNGRPTVFLNGGTLATNLSTQDWVKQVESLGAGEILLTSMDADGTKNGFDIALLKEINASIQIPLIASGGAGSINDFIEVFEKTEVDAALAASIFHFNEVSIPVLKSTLKQQNIEVRV